MRKKRTRMFLTLVAAAVFIMLAGFCHNFQAKNRDKYLEIANGTTIKATAHQIPTETYREDEKNKYNYTFVVDGATYAGSTIGKYSQNEVEELFIRYATDKDGAVKLLGVDEKIKIGEDSIRLASTYEDAYFRNSRAPTLTMTYAVYSLAGVALVFFVYYLVTFALLRNLEQTGTLTYGLFVEAYASKAGSNRHMAIRYKYVDENENWVEATTPYAYSIFDAEKFMALDTFKVRYKGKRSMIAEDVRRIHIE